MTYNPVTILRMREFGESVLSNLASSDPRVSGSIKISHPYGATSVVACGYAESVGDWVFVFSLVDGFVLFAKDQVSHWQQESEFHRTALACTPIAQSEQCRRLIKQRAGASRSLAA